MTKFLADECCELSLVRELRSKGHNVTYVPELKRGMPDHDVLRISKNEERILITEDRDFGELVYRLNKPAFDLGSRAIVRCGVQAMVCTKPTGEEPELQL